MDPTKSKLSDTLHIVWAIASKDIVDSVRNKLVISMIIGLGMILLLPKLLPLILTAPTEEILIYDPSNSRLTDQLEGSGQVRVRQSDSFQELEAVLANSMNTRLGLVVPAGSEQGSQLGLEGFVTWANRRDAPELKRDLEELISTAIGQPVTINIEGNIVFPSAESGLMLGLNTITAVTLMVMVGVTLVPGLLFEEKQTRTLEALLVSPASIGQVVAGKALAGLFYVPVTAAVVFAVNWKGVVHWEVAALCALMSGLFAVAVGLVLGSFFERQQEVTGWTALILVLLTGSIFVVALGPQVPASLQTILSWMPSVALAELFGSVFVEHVAWRALWSRLGAVLLISAILYAVVTWQVRRSDN
jgi:ABC-2 type transport system permease protein